MTNDELVHRNGREWTGRAGLRDKDEARQRLLQRVEEARRALGSTRVREMLRELGAKNASTLYQESEEKESRIHFESLKYNYYAEEYFDPSPSSPLYAILIKLESQQNIDDWEEQWLDRNRIFGPLAILHEDAYWSRRNVWNAAKSCRYWRRLNRPEEALRLSEVILKQTILSPRLMAALLTTRGAAFRDTYNFAEAERCATEAIGVAPENFQPYNLMGAICMQDGRPEQGYEYFSEAERLGAPRPDQARNIENAVRLAEPEAREHSARFLLQKDPERFQWAEAYLS
jgi:hypothetical protein